VLIYGRVLVGVRSSLTDYVIYSAISDAPLLHPFALILPLTGTVVAPDLPYLVKLSEIRDSPVA
jgi:hypothetical protein